MLTKSDVETSLRITTQFYSAALDKNLWPDVLEALVNVFDCQAAQISITKFNSDIELIANTSIGIKEESLRDWLAIENHMEIDPRSRKAFHLPNKILREIDLISMEEWHASEMYKNHMNPAGFDCSLVYMCQLDEDDMIAVLGLLRGTGEGSFGDIEVEKLNLYVPHFRQAISLAGEIHSQIEITRNLSRVFDRLRTPIFVTNRHAEIKYLNQMADRLVARSTEFFIVNGQLATVDANTTKAMRSAIMNAAVGTFSGDGGEQKFLLTVERADNDHRLLAAVAPISDEIPLNTPMAQMLAAVFVIDPEQNIETSSEILQRLYGLTSREADVMNLIGTGGTLRELAQDLGISYETIRSHLKRVYDKTGATSQAELGRLSGGIIARTVD